MPTLTVTDARKNRFGLADSIVEGMKTPVSKCATELKR